MKRPVISFRHFAGSGPLSIYWYEGPYGDAVEAKGGAGVGWFAPNGQLLGVEFDDVSCDKDHQTLIFANHETVEVRVARGKVSVQTSHPRKTPKVA